MSSAGANSLASQKSFESIVHLKDSLTEERHLLAS